MEMGARSGSRRQPLAAVQAEMNNELSNIGVRQHPHPSKLIHFPDGLRNLRVGPIIWKLYKHAMSVFLAPGKITVPEG